MIVVRLIAAALGAILLLPSTALLTTAGMLVTVGDVTPTSAVVWTRSVAPGEVRVEYGPIGGDATGLTVRFVAEDGSTLFTHTVAPR